MKWWLRLILGCTLYPIQVSADMASRYEDRVLPSPDGEPMSLGQYRGRKLLLMDFASW